MCLNIGLCILEDTIWPLTASSKVWDFVKGQKSPVGPTSCQPFTNVLGAAGYSSRH